MASQPWVRSVRPNAQAPEGRHPVAHGEPAMGRERSPERPSPRGATSYSPWRAQPWDRGNTATICFLSPRGAKERSPPKYVPMPARLCTSLVARGKPAPTNRPGVHGNALGPPGQNVVPWPSWPCRSMGWKPVARRTGRPRAAQRESLPRNYQLRAPAIPSGDRWTSQLEIR